MRDREHGHPNGPAGRDRNPAGAGDFFRKYFGPTQVVAFSRLDEAGQTAMAVDLEALWAGVNIAPDTANHTLVRNEYLQVTAIRL